MGSLHRSYHRLFSKFQPLIGQHRQIMTPIDRCRVCDGSFYAKPLLNYGKMPKSAQFLPDKESLECDTGINLEIRQCSACGLVQLNRAPVPYYRDVIRASAFSKEMRKFRKKQFAKFINKYSLHSKKIIEIGCGCGEYLSIIEECGSKAYGLEHAMESIKHCAENGLKAFKGFVSREGYRIPYSPFDGFMILNFLEHLPNPNATLRGICNNLDNSGVGLVEVPNFDMIIRKNLFSEFTSDHLFYFTRETLISTLNLNGYEILECKPVWHDYIISAEVKKRKMLELSIFHGCQKKIKKEINDYISKFGNKRVAIWGAGHQALAIMAMTDLGGRIKYVVDSAPFKQGRYTPVTHIPIVSPDKIDSDPVDAVIIMAASYSDEVAGILNMKQHPPKSIAILRNSNIEILMPKKAKTWMIPNK